MAVFKCKMCGGDLQVQDGACVVECGYCGTKQTVSTSDDEKRINLYNRANRLRLGNEFDKAAGVYEAIVAEFPEEAEAYWGLLLCHYGVEYVDDPATAKKVPTCHRSSFQSVMDDQNFDLACEYADSTARAQYRQEAKQLEDIRKGIIEVSAKEEPYDIFICYKETDDKGERTLDSVMAQDVYTALTEKGYKVFFSRISLEDKLGTEYEPYIFAALNSAKVMLAFGTDYEYYNAVWVKNEWSRFLRLMAAGQKKTLIPCYKNLDAYDIPKEFAKLQAQDMGKVGAMQDLLRGIDKIFDRDKKPAVVTVAPTQVPSGNVGALLKRAFMFLEDGEWQKADSFCEQVLNQDPENANAYLGKLMVELQVRKPNDLKDCPCPFDQLINYQKVMRFGDDDLKKSLTACLKYINERNETARLTGIYNKAKNTMNTANAEGAFKAAAAEHYFKAAAEAFASIPGFKDADEKAAECMKKAEEMHKEAIYNTGKSYMTGDSPISFLSAITQFEKISDYKDSAALIEKCQEMINTLQAREEERRLAAEESREKAKKTARIAALIVAVIVAVCIVILIVLTRVILPNARYNKAVALMEDGKYDEAIAAFLKTDGYKDSKGKIAECMVLRLNDLAENQISNLSDVKKGDIVKFGAYEQDADTTNGKEEIEWQVLDVKDGKALVISKYALDCQPYNTSYTDVTWESCSLRKWMNNTFINEAFGSKHQELIPSVSVSADKNPEYDTDPGNATTDKVFLLSITEAEKYFTTDKEARRCAPTAYAKAQGAYTSDSDKTASGEATCYWWLRSPGSYQVLAAYGCDDGLVGYYGLDVLGGDHCNLVCVRPAMWITLK